MARKINTRETSQPRKRVAGAGITEYWYLKHIKSLPGFDFELKPRFFGNESMTNINKLIDKAYEDGVPVICFYDEDVKQWNQVEAQRIKDLHDKYDNDESVTLACSMPSIEYWFLLHYENTNRYLRTSDDAINALKKYIPQFEKKENFLKHESWVDELIADCKMDVAMQRAEKFGRKGGGSYTDVWKGMKKLRS